MDIRLKGGKVLETKPTEENKTRLENIRELKSSINAYVQNADQPSLAGFLEEIALYTDIEEYNDGDDAVVMMTMHAAKGLEFPEVFVVGFEDGLFPGMRAIGDAEEMEEERRLCYVAITRAKQRLTISYAKQRMLYGRTNAALQSRFLKEIPEEFVQKKGGFYRTGYTDSEYRYTSHPQQLQQPKASLYNNRSGITLAIKDNHQVPTFRRGDMIQHTAFGKGLVISVIPMGGDALLEVAFDQIGTKKLMAKSAAAYLKKL